MEKGWDEASKKFFRFQDAIGQRLNDIGAAKGSTIRTAQGVGENIYKATGGDASKVTDEMISQEYDKLHAEPGMKEHLEGMKKGE